MTDITSINAALGNVSESLKSMADKAARDGELNNALRAKVDELLTNQGSLSVELKAAQQRLAELEGNGAGGDVQHVSSVDQFMNSDQFQAMQGRWGDPKASASMNFKAATITTSATDADGSAGALITPNYLPGVIARPDRRLTMRDLIGAGRTDSPVIQYVQERGFTNNAAVVPEGALKPESDISLESKTTSAAVIAHTMKASRQILDDASQIRSYMDNRLIRGLDVVVDNAILQGDGANGGLLGLLPQATTYAAPTTIADATRVDQLRLAMLQVSLAEYAANGIVMNPIDLAAIELQKDANNNYMVGRVSGTGVSSLWGLPVVATQAIAPGTFLVGAFDLAAQIFDLWAARVEVGYVNDDFRRNLVTLLAEVRLALAVYRPESLVKGTFA